MAFIPILLGLASLGVPTAVASPKVLLPQAALAMTSPWWEGYDTKDRYLCSERAAVVLERNASQAALISGGSRTTLFREASEAPVLIYRNDDLRLILRGDELTVERLPQTMTCLRSEEV
jgi:hypothetical protein